MRRDEEYRERKNAEKLRMRKNKECGKTKNGGKRRMRKKKECGKTKTARNYTNAVKQRMRSNI